MKKKSAWWIWVLQAVVLAIPLTWAVWTAVDPSILDSYNKAKVTEQNFWESLILQGNIVANIVPYNVSVFYLNGNGDFVSRDVTIYGYGIKSDKVTRCVQFYYPKDNAKQAKLREVCLYPEKPVKAETLPEVDQSPWGNLAEDLARLQKAIQELGESYTGSGYGPGTL